MHTPKRLGRQRSLTERSRALQLFTDRYELTRLFAKYLNEETPQQILVFHGDGGNGKTLLLKFLRERCCKRFQPEVWRRLKPQSADRVAIYIANAENPQTRDFTRVPSVLLDFEQKPIEDDRPQEPFYGLLMLRRYLAKSASKSGYSLRFPLYDFACVWYLLETDQRSPEQIKQLFPGEVTGLISSLVDLFSQTPYAGLGMAVLNLLGKYSGSGEKLDQRFTLYLQQRGLDEAEVDRIREMGRNPEELIYELPYLFAQDLNVAMAQPKAPERIVLFFDTHEAFWGKVEQRQLSGLRFFQQDEWLRYLIAELVGLELLAKVVVVVAGREPPRWPEATRYKVPQKHLNLQRVWHLSAADATVYLQQPGIEITDADLRQSLITFASVEPDQVHRLLLGLCADVVLQVQTQGVMLTSADFSSAADTAEKVKELIERLLKYVDRQIEYAVHALSACRAFDQALYLKLGQELNFTATEADFDILTDFSFVWQAEQRGQNWYRIHNLLRRLDSESSNNVTRRAHAALEQYYREQGEVAEAIYHANWLDWEQGIEEWVEVFDAALELSRYEQCRALLEVRGELSIQSDFQLGNTSQSEGNYFASLAQHEEAKQEYLESITAYEQALSQAPNYINAHNNKGNALQSLGNLQAELSQHREALESYQAAIAAYEQVLSQAPDYINAHNNKGLALRSLGNLQAGLSQHREALESYQAAIAAYEQVLQRAPDDVYVHNNKGLALQSLGNLQAELSQHREALESYQAAISAYEQALQRAPAYIKAYNNKGNALQSLGNLQAGLSQHREALESYQAAISVYEQVLSQAPDYINAYNNKGLALRSLGNLQAELFQHQEALQSYQDAITASEQALSQAPDYVYALDNKGNALQRLGDLQASLSQHREALQSWQAALAEFSRSLEIAPNNQYIRDLRDQLQDYLDNLNN